MDRTQLRLLARIETWATGTETGDLSEVPGLDDRAPLVPLVTSTRDNCLGSECPEFDACHIVRARRRAMAADLVVVNHHLFFADLALKEGGMGELLPSVQAVVMDEAHQILETGLQFMASNLGTLAVVDLARDLRAAGMEHARGLQDWIALCASLEQAAAGLALACDGARPEQGKSTRRLRWSERVSGRPDSAARPLEVAFSAAMDGLAVALEATQRAAAVVADAHPDLQRLCERASELQNRLEVFRSPVGTDRVRWIDVGANQARLIDSPLDIRALMAESRAQAARCWIFTSATLGEEPGLRWFRSQAGLEDAAVLVLGSPFDYPAHARLWVPTHLPDPGQPDHPQAVAELAARCAARLGGRTFVLATTLRALPLIGQRIRRLFEDRGLAVEVLVQGSEPRRALLDRFLKAAGGHGAVLVGAASFWEGIDVPGDALQCVVIDKLPFPPPDDPLLEARSRAVKAQGRDPFSELFLAEAAISLKQGAGRLIRGESDRGLLIIGDKRLAIRSYGARLLEALPPMARAQDARDVMQWIEALREGDS